jgi:hypothetical protein
MAPLAAAVAGLGAAAGGASGALGLIGTGLSAAGTIYSGIKAKQSADYESDLLKQRGDQEKAIASREAADRTLEKKLVGSRQQAIAAASGAGVDNPTVNSLMAKTEQRGTYNAMLEMYSGTQAKNDLYAQADVRKSEGKSALLGSFIEAGAGIYGDLSRKRRTTAEYSYGGY